MAYIIPRTNYLVNGLGGTVGFGEGTLVRNDDSSQRLDVSSVFTQGLNFFGSRYSAFYINNNGNITFASSQSQYTPSAITASTRNPIIAPFFADVDTRSSTVGVTPGGTSRGTNNVYYDLDTANGVVTITWDDVGYYSYGTDRRNAFQLQLVRRGIDDFDIVFRYEDINWTTGGASGGTGGLGGTVARAGWSAGDGDTAHIFELSASGNQGAILDLDSSVGNARARGLWIFEVRNGTSTTITRPRENFSDFDGDGNADILWFNNQTRQIAIWTMNGTMRSGAAAIQNTINPGWEVAGTGDFNGDARTDILFRRTTNGDLAIWTMNGLSRTAGAVLQEGGLPSSTRIAGVADTNGDGMSDIVLHDTNGDVTIWLMNGTSRLSAGVVQRGVNPAWALAGVGDFNGDGNSDILWRRTDTGLTAIWLMNGTTRLAGATIQETVNLAWSIQTVGDLNGDGMSDIVWRNTNGQIATWLMNGTTRMDAGTIGDGPLSNDWMVADASDFNSDGTSDLLLRNTRTGGTAVWTMNGTTRTSGAFIQESGDTSWQVASDYRDPLLRS